MSINQDLKRVEKQFDAWEKAPSKALDRTKVLLSSVPPERNINVDKLTDAIHERLFGEASSKKHATFIEREKAFLNSKNLKGKIKSDDEPLRFEELSLLNALGHTYEEFMPNLIKYFKAYLRDRGLKINPKVLDNVHVLKRRHYHEYNKKFQAGMLDKTHGMSDHEKIIFREQAFVYDFIRLFAHEAFHTQSDLAWSMHAKSNDKVTHIGEVSGYHAYRYIEPLNGFSYKGWQVPNSLAAKSKPKGESEYLFINEFITENNARDFMKYLYKKLRIDTDLLMNLSLSGYNIGFLGIEALLMKACRKQSLKPNTVFKELQSLYSYGTSSHISGNSTIDMTKKIEHYLRKRLKLRQEHLDDLKSLRCGNQLSFLKKYGTNNYIKIMNNHFNDSLDELCCARPYRSFKENLVSEYGGKLFNKVVVDLYRMSFGEKVEMKQRLKKQRLRKDGSSLGYSKGKKQLMSIMMDKACEMMSRKACDSLLKPSGYPFVYGDLLKQSA